MIGSPKEHIDNTIKLFLDDIAQDESIILLRQDLEETIPLEGNMFSAAAECDYLIQGIEKLTWLAFNFMPASIEITAPKELTFRDKDFTNWLGDLLSKLHEVNTIHTGLKNEHAAMVKNINALVRNNILLALGKDSLTAAEISKRIGMSTKNVLPFLEALIKEQKIVHKNNKYSRK